MKRSKVGTYTEIDNRLCANSNLPWFTPLDRLCDTLQEEGAEGNDSGRKELHLVKVAVEQSSVQGCLYVTCVARKRTCSCQSDSLVRDRENNLRHWVLMV